MYKNGKKIVSMLMIIAMLFVAMPISSLAEADFSIAVDTVTVDQGETDVITVPVRITSIASDLGILCLGVNFTFDPTKLVFQTSTNPADFAGSMIKNPSADTILGASAALNGSQGVLKYDFFTDNMTYLLDKAKVDEDNVYIYLKFKLADGVTPGTYPINIVPTSEMLDGNFEEVISEAAMSSHVLAGAINVGDGGGVVETTVKQVSPFTKVTAQQGAAWNTVLSTLPAKAQVTYSDDTTGELSVNWTMPASYNGSVGNYTINGTLVLPSGVTMSNGVSSAVTVALEVTEEEVTVIQIVNYDPITLTVNNGTSITDVINKLPIKVVGYAASGGSQGQFDVTWNTPSNYNAILAGTYTFTGQFTEKTGYSFTKPLTASITVKTTTNSYNPSYGDTDTDAKPIIKFVLGNYSYSVNNSVKATDAPFIYNDEGDRSMAPIRFIAEALGYKVEWDNISKVTIKKDQKTVILEIGSETMYVNGVATEMDTAPILRYDRTYIPVRFIAEAFGLTVSWNSETQETTLN